MDLGLEEAVYDDGILTIQAANKLPEDTDKMQYEILRTENDAVLEKCAEGMLDDIISDRARFTLDLTKLELSEGDYVINIEGNIVKFTVR